VPSTAGAKFSDWCLHLQAALAHPSVVESLCALQLETLTPERVSAATQLRRNSSFWLLLGLGILTVGASKQYEVAGGGALAVLVMSVCCSFSWNSVFSKHVSGRMADSWALVQRALFATMGASVDIWGMTAFTVQWATTLVAAGLGVRCLAALLVSNSGGRHDMSLAERVFGTPPPSPVIFSCHISMHHERLKQTCWFARCSIRGVDPEGNNPSGPCLSSPRFSGVSVGHLAF
jgi:VanZ family protein